jgi:hypothetical protein
MLPLTPQFLVSTATAFASCEYQRNPEDAEQDRSEADATRGDASLRFVNFAGFWSHFTHLGRCSSWPLPASERIEDLVAFAERSSGVAPTPGVGDVFVLASIDGGRHVLAGIIAAVETTRTMLDGCLTFVCTTIEGQLGEPEANGVLSRIENVRVIRRRLSPAFGDCFIRWCGLGAHALPATFEYEVPEDLISVDRGLRQKAA